MEERERDAKKIVNDSPMGTVWITYKFSLNCSNVDLLVSLFFLLLLFDAILLAPLILLQTQCFMGFFFFGNLTPKC